MLNVLRVKPGVLFTTIAPGGFEIISALTSAAMGIEHDLTITSACDGEHSGPNDPHHRGEAYDVRTHDLPDKQKALDEIMRGLTPGRFYGFIEDEGTDNEHIHVQVQKGTEYP